jgi:uncharacterized protein (TIGR04255 family)
MNFENLHPASGDHAVQSVHFVVEWAEPLASDAILALGKLHTKFRNLGYSIMTPQHRLSIHLEAAQSASGSASHAINGYLFSQRAQTEISRQVSVTAESCAIMFPDYTRWDSVFSDVQELLKIVLEDVGPQRPVRTIGLQYHDAFTWSDDPEELDLREIFNNDFMIPPSIFHQNGLWHLHHGYFESFDRPVSHTVLNNVNVEMVESGSGRRLQVLGSHKATLNEVLWQPHKKNQDTFQSMLNHLHALNKQMLRSLFSEKVRQRIKLDS